MSSVGQRARRISLIGKSPRRFHALLGRCVLICLALPFAPAPALAEEEVTSDAAASANLLDAGQHYDAGLKLYAEGEYPLAVIEFDRAYELVPDYRVLYNIGQVRLQLANYARAHRALTQYLKEGADRIAEERRASVMADLQMLASRTATLKVETNVNGAELLVNDLVVGVSPLSEPLLLDAGEHRLSARKVGYHTRITQVTLAGRDASSVRLELEKSREGSIIVQQQATSDRRAWIVGTWSAAGALAVGSVVTGVLGIKAANNLAAERDRSDATRDELQSQSRRATTLLRTADVLGGLAIVSGGVALYLTLSNPSTQSDKPSTPRPRNDSPHAQLLLGPGFVGLNGTY